MLAVGLGIPLITLIFLLVLMTTFFLVGCEVGHRAERKQVISKIRDMAPYEEMWGIQVLSADFFEGKCEKLDDH